MLSAGYVWDDDSYLTENPLIPAADGLSRIWLTTETPQYYPLTFTSFWLEYRLWGYEPTGYHLVNVLLHALNAFLVGLVLHRSGLGFAWWVAVLFAVHPVHVESVAWITERKNTLSGTFYLLAALAWLAHRRRGAVAPYLASLGAYVAALLSKTVTVTLPVALAIVEWCRHGRIDRAALARLAPMLAVGTAVSWITVALESRMVVHVASDFDFSRLDRLRIAARAVCFYPAKLLAPYPLAFNYRRWDLDGETAAWLGSAVLVVGIASLLAWLALGGRRLVPAAAAFFVLTVSPALGFFDVYPFRYAFVADHFQYLASLGVLVGVVALVVRGGERLARSWPPGRIAGLGRGLGVIVVVALAALTWRQAGHYADADTLWRATLVHNPDSWIARHNLAVSALASDDFEDALAGFDDALVLKPESAESLTGRGQALAGLGRHDEALTAFDRALELDPAYPQAALNRGLALLALGRPAEAIDSLSSFLATNDGYLPALEARIRARMALGHFDEALADVDRALEAGAGPNARFDRGVMLFNLRRYEESVEAFTRAIDAGVQTAQAYGTRALAYARLRRFDESLADVERSLAIEPSPEAYDLKGQVLRASGADAAEACEAWRRACELGDCRRWRVECRGEAQDP